jgi:hypothetical protein
MPEKLFSIHLTVIRAALLKIKHSPTQNKKGKKDRKRI